MIVKQEDIAEKLGISRTTVARALNGSGSIKESTKESILKVAEEMGYIKNTVGSVLATKKEKLIYVFLAKSINKYYLKEIHRGLKRVEKEFSFLKFNFIIIETDIDKPEEQVKNLRKVIENENIDGVIITPLMKNEIKKVVEENKDKVSFLMLDSFLCDDVAYVGSNYFYNAQITAKILDKVLRKDEKVLLFNSIDDNISSSEYYNGFTKFIKSTDKHIIDLGFIHKDDKNIIDIIKPYINDNEIIAIYTPRFTNTLIKELVAHDVDFKNIKIVAQSKGGEMQKYLTNDYVVAVVEEILDDVAYQAGKFMIENIYYNKDISKIKKYVNPKIIVTDEK